MPDENTLGAERNLLTVLEALNGIDLRRTVAKAHNKTAETVKVSQPAKPAEAAMQKKPEQIAFSLADWPSSPSTFVRSRALLCRKNVELPIHFREARGLDYNAKRNLLHSLLNARNHMALITVAEDDGLDLASYTVLPLNLDGKRDDPCLLALDLRESCLKKFRVKNITRVKEVFYSFDQGVLCSACCPAAIFLSWKPNFRMKLPYERCEKCER